MKRAVAKKSIVGFVLSLCLMSLLPVRAMAWGNSGHRIVARIAEKYLSVKARQAVAQLLNGETLESVATYADAIRQSRPETQLWHFVDIPRNQNDYDPARDCQCTRYGDCVIEAIEQFKVILADPKAKTARRAEALKFLVHFVGDLHQPLHCADDNDRGGNDVMVTFFGETSNLHKVWDVNIIAKTGLSETDYANKLTAALASQDIPGLQAGTVTDWALESHQGAVAHSYLIPANKVLDTQYFDDNRPIVDDQLSKAGVRLARILNEAFQ